MYPTAAYIHVPFCAHHCGYCDFAVSAGQDHLMDRYLDALSLELATLGEPRPMQTLFIGGGTPTYLAPRQLERLLADLDRWLPRVPDAEFSIESTPDSIDPGRIDVLARDGVNRISIGVQSFSRDRLRMLDRVHNPDDIPRAVECARRSIPTVSLDLIFGVPGQSVDEWNRDLDSALALAPQHVATYGLTFEKGTPLWKQMQRGAVRQLDDEAELLLYEHAIDRLTAAGFEHYEISNFARAGNRCRHNQVYWANQPYLGFGVGAARYVNGCRQLNVRSTEVYIRRVLAGESPVFHSETLTPYEQARETMALQLRRADGIDRTSFREQTGHDLDELAGAALRYNVDRGLLADDGRWVRLSRQGKYVADAVIVDLLKESS